MNTSFSKRIFVIDDTAFMRANVVKSLAELGFDSAKISQFVNGREALQKLQEGQACDLILCDWNMPLMTGLELLKNLRADSVHSQTPFILITTESERDKVVEAIHYKVNGYLLKPLNLEKLKESLENIFDSGEIDEQN